MKKRISLALAAVFAFGLSSCSLGGANLKDYNNDVDVDDYVEELEDTVKDLGFDEEETFECDYEIKFSHHSEKIAVTTYDRSSKEFKETTTGEQELTYTYDSDNGVIHAKQTDKEDFKGNNEKSSESATQEMYLQEKGRDLVIVNPLEGTFSEYGEGDIEDYAVEIVLDAFSLGGLGGNDAEYYVDENVFTITTEIEDSGRDSWSNFSYETSSKTVRQMILEETKITIIEVVETTSEYVYDDYSTKTTRTATESTVISLKNTTVKAQDLSKYIEL